jgi:hypothetical protein
MNNPTNTNLIMAKNKIIKTATLEKRFEKLHNAANYTEECVRAIVFHAARLSQKEQSDIQSNAYQKMAEAIEEWCGKFAKLGSDMQEVESKYYEHLSPDNTECEQIEVVPNFMKNGYATPDTFQVDAKLFEIGYYELEGDPYSVATKVFSTEEIIADIQKLQENMIFFVKALANADYKGVWKSVGDIVIGIYESVPNTPITNFLEAYGVDYSSDDV